MDFVKLDDFLDDVLAEVPGCPIYTARDHVRRAAIEFCKQTGVSTHTTVDIDIDADEAVMTLPCPSVSVQSWQVLWLRVPEQGIVGPLARRSMVEHGLEWEGQTGNPPRGYVRLNRNEIQLVPTPDADESNAMSIHCSYIPQKDATYLDAILMDEYREAITSGALSRLLRMSKEDWYDRMEAQERKEWFAIAMSEARALADKDFQTGEQTVAMNPMA